MKVEIYLVKKFSAVVKTVERKCTVFSDPSTPPPPQTLEVIDTVIKQFCGVL